MPQRTWYVDLAQLSRLKLTQAQYMPTTANQRRSRGLSATVIHLGMIIGVGYMNQAGANQIEMMEKRYDYMRVSETQLHDIFTQAIVAGRPDSGYPFELITGLKPASDDPKPLWYENPIFSHHRARQSEKRNGDTKSVEKSSSVRQQILEASSEQEALELLLEFFQNQVAQILQLPAGRIKTSEPLIELGVDSLMAVEISSRFFKDLGHKVSVLKILGGLSASESKLPCLARESYANICCGSLRRCSFCCQSKTYANGNRAPSR
jgi:hypothetical protein